MIEKNTLILAAFISVVLLLVISVIFQGTDATAWLVVIIGIVALGLAGIATLAWVVWEWFLKPKAPRMSKEVKKQTIASAHMSKSPLVGDLWLRGDAEHFPVRLGLITGHMEKERLVTLGKSFVELGKRVQSDLMEMNCKQLRLKETHFTFKMYGMPLLWRLHPEEVFVAISKAWAIYQEGVSYTNGKKMTAKLCGSLGGIWNDGACEIFHPELTQHSPLIGDVELFGVSANRVNQNFYLPQYESSTLVDQIAMMDEMRALGHYVYDEMAGLTGKAIQSNVPHKIAMEEEKLIPVKQIQEGVSK